MSARKFPALQRLNSAQDALPLSPRSLLSKRTLPNVEIPLETPVPDTQRTFITGSSPLYAPTPNPNLESESSTPRINRVKPIVFPFEKGQDEVLDLAISKLDGILVRHAQKNHRKKLQIEPEKKDPDAGIKSETERKNRGIIRRVTKYKQMMGITPKTKDVRFEDKLQVFKDVKTFIDIKPLVKEISTPKTLSSEANSGSGFRHAHVRRKASEPKSFKDYLQVERNFSKTSSSPRVDSIVESSTPRSPVSASKSSARVMTGANPVVRFSGIDTIKEEIHENKESNKDVKVVKNKLTEAYNDLKEQIVKKMGPEVLQKANKMLKRPLIHEKIVKKKNIDLKNIRKTQKDLTDFGMFNSIVDYLSTEEASVQETGHTLREYENPQGFYKEIQKSLFDEEDRLDEWISFKDRAATLGNESIEEQDEEDENDKILKEKIAWAMAGIPQGLIDDEQIQVIRKLQEYKRRSDKVISILRNRTKRICDSTTVRRSTDTDFIKGQLDHVARFSGLEKDRLDSTMASTGAFSRKKGVDMGGYNKGLSIRTGSVFGSMQASSRFAKGLQEDLETRKGSLDGAPQRFHSNTLTNKKKFIELNHKKSMQSTYYLNTGSHKEPVDVTLKGYRSLTQYGGFRDFEGVEKKQDKFNMTVSKICDDVSSLLVNNHTLNGEVKRSIAEVDRYYIGKTRMMEGMEVPESLKLPKKMKDFNKRANFIMDLTRKLLKDNANAKV